MADAVLDVSDRLNPIVVKDVRQGLRTRAFSASFSLLLAVSVIISVVAWSAWTPHALHDSGTVGQGAFIAYLSCFGFVGFLVLPLSLHRSFLKEREAETWQLLVMTGVKPRRILRGKIASGLVQGALYASAIAPFVLFSYFLQGISLFGILLAMGAAFLWQAFLTTAAVTSAAFAEQKYMRSLVGAIWGLSVPISTLVLLSGGVSVFSVSRMGLASWNEWWLVATAVWAVVTIGFVLFEAAAARLMSAGENHAVGPRIATFVHLVGLLVLPAMADGKGQDLAIAVLCYGSAAAFIYGLFAISDTDGATPAIRASRWPSLLKPGALRGFIAALLFECLAVAAALVIPDAVGSTYGRLLVLIPAWVAIYLALPVVICRGLLPDLAGRPAAMRFVTLGLAVIAFMVMPVFMSHDRGLMGLMNPVLSDSETSLALPVVLAAVLVLAAFVVLFRRARQAEAR